MSLSYFNDDESRRKWEKMLRKWEKMLRKFSLMEYFEKREEELWRKEQRNHSKVLQLRPTVYLIRKVKWVCNGLTYWNLGMSLGMSPKVLEKAYRSAECHGMARDWIIPMLTEWLNHGNGTGNKKRTWGTIFTAIANGCSRSAALCILEQVIDIEGMCAQILSKKPTLQEIEELILHNLGEDWDRVGQLLGMSPKVMKEIGSKFGSVPTQCSEAMFSKWLNCEEGTGHKKRTWGTVLTALEDAGRGDVAISVLDKLTVKHKEDALIVNCTEEALKKAPNIRVIKLLVIPRVAPVWFEIGQCLGIIKAILIAIESEVRKKILLKQTCEMFQLWLDGREGTRDKDRSWLVILRVLVDIGRSDIKFEIQGHFDLKTKDIARILSLLCDDTQSSSHDIPVSPTTTTVPTTSQGTDQSLVCSKLNDNVGQVSLHDCIENDGEVEEDKGLDRRGKFPSNQHARSRRRQKLKKQNYGFPSILGLHMREKCLVTFDLPGKSRRRKMRTRRCLSEKLGHSGMHHPNQPGFSGQKRRSTSGDLEESDLDFSTSPELSEEKNQSKLSKSKSKKKRSYSNVPAKFVIQKITREKLNDGVKSMLNGHRVRLLYDDWKLLDESYKNIILGLLEKNDIVNAADQLIDYFENAHYSEDLLMFTRFLRGQANNDGRNTRLLNLAKSIEEAVYSAFPKDQ